MRSDRAAATWDLGGQAGDLVAARWCVPPWCQGPGCVGMAEVHFQGGWGLSNQKSKCTFAQMTLQEKG